MYTNITNETILRIYILKEIKQFWRSLMVIYRVIYFSKYPTDFYDILISEMPL